jgi:hypothetical protein
LLLQGVVPFISNRKGHFVTVQFNGKFGSPYRSGCVGQNMPYMAFFDVLRMEHQKTISMSQSFAGFIQTNVAVNTHLREMDHYKTATTKLHAERYAGLLQN